MRGELDWIVMKALEKQRTRSYETANAFTLDVQRYLAGERVDAVPPSAAYRLQKFVRKKRGAVLASLLIFVTLLEGIIGTSIGIVRANKARDDESRRAKTEEDAKIYAEGKRLEAEEAKSEDLERFKERDGRLADTIYQLGIN